MDKNKAYHIIRKYFLGKLSSRNMAIVSVWLTMNRHSAEKDYALRKIWDEEVEEMDNDTLEVAWQHINDKINDHEETVSRRHHLSQILRYAAMFLVPIVTFALAWQWSQEYHAPTTRMVECFASDGETKQITLSDGTNIILNGGSRIIYPEKFASKGVRNVFMQGEAHFDVAHDEKCPFIANVENIDIRVLGTTFNIRAYADEDEITATLEKGSINVSCGKQQLLLKPNEQAVYNRSRHIIEKKSVIADGEKIWTKGTLSFENKPLQFIISSVGHSYGVKFNVDDDVNLNKHYTLNFNSSESLDEILKVLNILQSDNIYFELHGNIVTVRKGKK